MKTHRFFIITSVVTVVALAYVGQQTNLVSLSYKIKEEEKLFSELLDRNKILSYNIKRLESPARLESVLLAKNIKLEVPSKERLILVSAATVPQAEETSAAIGILGRIRQVTASLFTLGTEAEARPVK